MKLALNILRCTLWLAFFILVALLLGFLSSTAHAADLTITAANVLQGTDGSPVTQVYTAGAAITAGQALYLDAATSTAKLAINTSLASSKFIGVALHAAANGQPVVVQQTGTITIGATTVQGVIYVVSGNAGAICPTADLSGGHFVTVIGVATDATHILIKPNITGISQ